MSQPPESVISRGGERPLGEMPEVAGSVFRDSFPEDMAVHCPHVCDIASVEHATVTQDTRRRAPSPGCPGDQCQRTKSPCLTAHQGWARPPWVGGCSGVGTKSPVTFRFTPLSSCEEHRESCCCPRPPCTGMPGGQGWTLLLRGNSEEAAALGPQTEGRSAPVTRGLGLAACAQGRTFLRNAALHPLKPLPEFSLRIHILIPRAEEIYLSWTNLKGRCSQ